MTIAETLHAKPLLSAIHRSARQHSFFGELEEADLVFDCLRAVLPQQLLIPIARSFCDGVFDLNYKATIGVDFLVAKFDILGKPFSLHMFVADAP